MIFWTKYEGDSAATGISAFGGIMMYLGIALLIAGEGASMILLILFGIGVRFFASVYHDSKVKKQQEKIQQQQAATNYDYGVPHDNGNNGQYYNGNKPFNSSDDM